MSLDVCPKCHEQQASEGVCGLCGHGAAEAEAYDLREALERMKRENLRLTGLLACHGHTCNDPEKDSCNACDAMEDD